MSSSRPERRWAAIAELLLLSLGIGCGSDDDAGPRSALSVTAELPDTAQAADAVVVWSVQSGTPNYTYLWGRASMQAGRAHLELASPPPSAAINSYGLGVGFVLVLPSANIARSGELTKDDEATWLKQTLGAATQHPVLYIDHAQAERDVERLQQSNPSEVDEVREHWLFDFPDGYSCGESRPAPAGKHFDSFVPVDCAALKVERGTLPELEFPNWT